MFEFLFKYRPVVFERGDFELALPFLALFAVFALIGLLVAFLLRYRGLGPELAPRDRWILGGIRTAVLAVLAFALFRPMLVVSTVVPRRNYLPVLIDDSRSMRVTDAGGVSRLGQAAELFGAPGSDSAGSRSTGELREALADRFQLRTWGFGSQTRQVEAFEELRFGQERTDLATALTRVRQEMEALPVSGIVVVTDGADNGDGSIGEAITGLRSAGVPVYAIGLGDERLAPDVELRRVEVPRRALEGTTVVADVILSHTGVAGRSIRLDVEDDGRLLGSRDIELGIDGETPVQVQFTLEESGPRELRFVVAPLENEAVADNNRRTAMLDVRSERRKVLYFEGVPRPELKFLRRAVADDENLQVVTLLRSADEKYFRLDVDDADELAEGFPETREELYRYAGLVLGDVEASFFTHDQLQMMADFVSRRGGGLLVLGGRHAFAEGGYAGTPLADALPVVLDTPAGELVEILPELTRAGTRHPAVRLAEDQRASADRWASLPPLTMRNLVTRVKPGAVSLLTGRPVDGSDARILLAYQRFGRGTSIAFTAQDSWLWQMHADIPVEDQTHETLWKQLLRWVVHDTPNRLQLELTEETVLPDDPVALRAVLEDERFLAVNSADVSAVVTGPDGVPVETRLDWTVERDGVYEGSFTPSEPGLYRVDVRTGSGDDEVTATGYFRAGEPELEAFGAGRRTELLARLAEETGGAFYTFDEAPGLAADAQYSESGDTVREVHPLWDMPVLLLLLGALLTGEWTYRNRRDLA